MIIVCLRYDLTLNKGMVTLEASLKKELHTVVLLTATL